MPVRISWPAVVATVHPNIGGFAGGFITRKNINPWYEVSRSDLRKAAQLRAIVTISDDN